jgi:ATP-binding cassette subfamily C protein CydD
MLLALWATRSLMVWRQGRLAQKGASGAIADLSRQVLTLCASLPPRRLNERRDDAAVVVTRGLDGLRPYFTAYLPALVSAAVLTPATLVVMAAYDWQSALIVIVALPLIPIFMVLIGLATADRSAASLKSMGMLQARLLDLVAGLPTLRALRRVGAAPDRIAEFGASHRRSAMATLRIAFLSALVMELLATLGVALVAVSVGLRLVYGDVPLASALTALLLAPEVFWPLRRVGAAFDATQDGRYSYRDCGRGAHSPRGSRRGRRTGPRDGDHGTEWDRKNDAPAGDPRPRRTNEGPYPHRWNRRSRFGPGSVVGPGGMAGAAASADSGHGRTEPGTLRPLERSRMRLS